jgi:hypothetical protein
MSQSKVLLGQRKAATQLAKIAPRGKTDILHDNAHSGSASKRNKKLLEFLRIWTGPALRSEFVRFRVDIFVEMRVPDVHADRDLERCHYHIEMLG